MWKFISGSSSWNIRNILWKIQVLYGFNSVMIVRTLQKSNVKTFTSLQKSNVKTFPSTNLRMLKHSQKINNYLLLFNLKEQSWNCTLVSLLQTLRPSSLPKLITVKPAETRHLTDKVCSQMRKFTLITARGANFFIQSLGS